MCSLFAISKIIPVCVCLMQGDTGIQGIPGVNGAQVLRA